jgi:quinol monooxygenase YgiN
MRAAGRREKSVIVFSMRIVAPDEKRAILVRSLAAMLGPTRAAPGCLDARLYADLGNPKALLLVEEWESRDQFNRQLDPDRLKMLVAAIELSSQTPRIFIDSVSRENGLDALAMHRSTTGGAAL